MINFQRPYFFVGFSGLPFARKNSPNIDWAEVRVYSRAILRPAPIRGGIVKPYNQPLEMSASARKELTCGFHWWSDRRFGT
jgi:hypothetical protein